MKLSKFTLDPAIMTESLAKGAVKRLQRECAGVEDIVLSINLKGFKNLQKQCKKLFEDDKVAGMYVGDKDCIAMFLMFDENKQQFFASYIAIERKEVRFYNTEMLFSKHAVQRLIQRLKIRNPRLEVAKALHEQVKYLAKDLI